MSTLNTASNMMSRIMLATVTLTLASVVLGHPMSSTGYKPVHPRNCSVYYGNLTSNGVNSSTQGNRPFGLVGQEKNYTFPYGIPTNISIPYNIPIPTNVPVPADVPADIPTDKDSVGDDNEGNLIQKSEADISRVTFLNMSVLVSLFVITLFAGLR
ncbi:hypothetical protein F4776DRAFT_675428 [Hypoxylon sp. NC0597]|nr:hypothetical protein F4776DRAFT_675428 [Hypoxylon sp. NC0597]